MPDRHTTEQLGEILARRKEELLERLQMSAEAWAELQEKPVELEEQATNISLAARFERQDDQTSGELNRIEKALVKIRNDRYGTCESCGKTIKTERLLAIPDAEQCLACAAGKTPLAGEAGEEHAGAVLPEELRGLDDEQLARQVGEYLRVDERIPTEELEVTSADGLVALTGCLPSRKSHEILLQILQDRLGLRDIEDHLIVDRQVWEDRRRNPGRRLSGRTGYDKVTQGAGTDTSGPVDSQKSGLPMDPADELVPERER